MQIIKVNLNQNSYEINIGPGLIVSTGDLLKNLGFRDKAVIITNPVVGKLFGYDLKGNLESRGIKTCILEVPDGEEQKSLEWAGRLYNQMADFQAERMTPVLALGGGVIGDLAGFVAATYMRGIPLIQIPTTLLAQVDSSIGGKVAVNHGRLKNTVGTFYQPRVVITDISTLRTLPAEELTNGLAETIKYGIIRDKALFELIEKNMARIKQTDKRLLEEVIFRCAGIKAEVVEKDEKDVGLRNILNFGHTVGHAIETVSDFKIKHGQGVAVGMLAASIISYSMGILADGEIDRIKSVIKTAGLPVDFPHLDVQKVMLAMEHDKKRVGGKMRFILLKSIGQAVVNDDVSPKLVERVLKDLHE